MMQPIEDGMWFCWRCQSYWYENQIEAHMAEHDFQDPLSAWSDTATAATMREANNDTHALQTLVEIVREKMREQERVYTAEDKKWLQDCGISTEGL